MAVAHRGIEGGTLFDHREGDVATRDQAVNAISAGLKHVRTASSMDTAWSGRVCFALGRIGRKKGGGSGEFKPVGWASMTLLNLKKSDLEKHIYRIMRPEHLYDLFQTRQNVLVSPTKWEDPFENFILKAPAVLPGGESVSFGFHDAFYGQCWTLHQASDAMWRIYSARRHGVRVRTTIGKLINSLVAAAGSTERFQAHIGQVEYLSQKGLQVRCQRGIRLTDDGAEIAQTLLVKRLAFRHEREVRLLFFANPGDPISNGMFRYHVDPSVLTEQLMVDPRLSYRAAQTFQKKIQRLTGFQGPVLRSALYAPPKGFVTRIL
jgi:hypothetical protein